MINIHTVTSSASQYYYQCQKCLDSFICPDWRPLSAGRKADRVAVCPYCKSKQLDALNAALPRIISGVR